MLLCLEISNFNFFFNSKYILCERSFEISHWYNLLRKIEKQKLILQETISQKITNCANIRATELFYSQKVLKHFSILFKFLCILEFYR